MTLPNIDLRYPGKPCNGSRIRAIEREIKRKLPNDYADFVKNTGGGIVSLKNCVLEDVYLPSGIELDSNLDQIFGNGTTSNGSSNDLVDYVRFLTEEWEIPHEVLLIGSTESGMHECFVINYDLANFPQHSVLYLDNESEDGFVLVADSFGDFLGKLRPTPDYKEVEQSPYDGEKGIYAAREGRIEGSLAGALAASEIPNMEAILRRAAEPLATGNIIQMAGGEDAFRFQDLLFYLAQPFENHYSVDTWKELTKNENFPFRIPSLLGDSFLKPDGSPAVSFFEGSMILWWEDRTKLGVLVETPHGFKLKDEHIERVISTLQ